MPLLGTGKGMALLPSNECSFDIFWAQPETEQVQQSIEFFSLVLQPFGGSCAGCHGGVGLWRFFGQRGHWWVAVFHVEVLHKLLHID